MESVAAGERFKSLVSNFVCKKLFGVSGNGSSDVPMYVIGLELIIASSSRRTVHN